MIKVMLSAAAIVLMLCGCATHVISSNPRNVVVESNMMDAGEAQRLADAECAKHKRIAKMTLKPYGADHTYTFECVE